MVSLLYCNLYEQLNQHFYRNLFHKSHRSMDFHLSGSTYEQLTHHFYRRLFYMYHKRKDYLLYGSLCLWLMQFVVRKNFHRYHKSMASRLYGLICLVKSLFLWLFLGNITRQHSGLLIILATGINNLYYSLIPIYT